MAETSCPWCETSHDDRYLCDPVKAYLDAIVAKADGYSLPDLAFDQPMPAPPAELGDVWMRQVVINGGTAVVAGTKRPLIVLTGVDADNKPLPRWTFIATAQDLTRVRNTFDRMCSLAIDAARKP